MPLSRVICVTHYTGFPFGSASFTELLCWCGTVLSALPQFTCRNSVALCRPSMVGRQALRSSSGGKLLVPRVNTSTTRVSIERATSRNSDKSKTVSKERQEYCRFELKIVFLMTKLTLIITLIDPYDT